MSAQIVASKVPQPYRILSLDGGGAKGFYTIGILSEIEARVKQPLSACFDLIFGTSTGAIIGGLIARGEEMATVQRLYEAHVPAIMKNQSRSARTKSLHSTARAVFGDDDYNVFKTGIGIVATNWKDERPFIFKNRVDQAYASKGSFEPFFGVSIADAVIASCSAYPFFNRHTVQKSNGDEVELADGGFCANNPTLFAIADATVALQHVHSNVRIISLGVGSYPPPGIWKIAKRAVRNVQLIRHAASSGFLQKMLDTNTRSMEILGGILFKDIPTVRIHDPFSEPDMATDLLEHNLKKLNRLVQKGRDSFRKHEDKIAEFLEA